MRRVPSAKVDHRALDIVLIPDLSHNLFHQILNRHQTGDSPIFIHHQGHMGPLPLHLSQEEADLHRFGDEERRFDDLPEVDLPCFGQGGEKVFRMEDSPDVIQVPCRRQDTGKIVLLQ